MAQHRSIAYSQGTRGLAVVGLRSPLMVASASRSHALLSELDGLVSEERNPRTMAIDLQSTAEILGSINQEDRLVPEAVAKVIPEITAAVDKVVAAFGRGGRLIYMGAGTSGRLGVLDAAECPPTFGVPPGMVVGLIAGGADALVMATEGAEDSAEGGAQALRDIGLTRNDVVVGIAVSGRTPYVIGGLNFAKQVGATTVALSCNPAPPSPASPKFPSPRSLGPRSSPARPG